MSGSITTQPENFTESRIIIPEGKADQHFLSAFIKNRNIKKIQIVRDFGGLSDNNIEKRLDEIEVGVSKIKSILIVVDSDSDAERNFQKAVKQIKNTKRYGVPVEFKKRKKMSGRPSIALLSIPDGSLGCLETLLLEVFLKNARYSKISKCLEKFFNCSDAKEWDISKQSKMKLNALISATCKDSPECKVAEMWQEKRKFRDLLSDNTLDGLEDFLRKFARW